MPLASPIGSGLGLINPYNIRVINMSLGAGVFESYNTDPLTLAAKRAVDHLDEWAFGPAAQASRPSTLV